MGKGRAPCCDKSQVKKGPWSPAEDLRLVTFIQKHGHENWRALPKQAGLLRCGKSCRLRWINYLRPDVKRGNFTKEEEDSIINLHQTLGNKWSKIASHFPGRTDNEIKNVWNTHLKKRLAFKDPFSKGDESKECPSISSSSSSSSINMSTGAVIELDHQWNHESVTEMTHVSEDIQGSHVDVTRDECRPSNKEAQEMPSSSSSSSSSSSNNSNITNCSQVDVSMPDDSLFNFSGHYVGNTFEEVPFEADLDFWNMLDGLNSLQPNEQVQLHNVENSHSSSLEGEYNGEVENRKWFRYLENELGLEATRDSKHQNLSQVPETYHHEIPMKAEVNAQMGYYHQWPSL